MAAPHTRPSVLVGVGGSDARAAVAAATEEARLRSAPLHLLTVTTWPAPDVSVAPEPDGEGVGLVRGGVEERLRELAAGAALVLGAGQVSWSVEDGDPVRALSAAAADAQLLVVGPRAAGGVAGLLLGSTAAALVQASPCPVVVVPDETAALVRGRSSVVVGVEGRGDDEDLLGFAVAEAVTRRTDLVAVHAWQDAVVETGFRSAGPLVDWAGVMADEQRLLSEALAGWVAKEPDLVVREVVVRERPAAALLAAGMTAELLVVGHRRRRVLDRLGSVTHAVLHRAWCPVAVVPLRGTR